MKKQDEIIKECKRLRTFLGIEIKTDELLKDKLLRARAQALEWVLEV